MDTTTMAGPTQGSSLSGRVTILNASYEPLGHTSIKHAIRMLVRQVAEVEEAHGDLTIGPFAWPRVIRLVRYVAPTWLYRKAARYSRTGVLIRDRYQCCYCAGRASTIDHVVPASRGGESDWLNLVASCEPCNNRKRNRTPREAGLYMRWQPFVPTLAHQAGL